MVVPRRQRRRHGRHTRGHQVLLPALVVLVLLGGASVPWGPSAVAAPALAAVIVSAGDPSIGWTRWWETPVYSAPTIASDLITRLDRNQRVAVRGAQRDAAGLLWTRILVWNTFDGWIPAHFVAPRPASPATSGGVAHYRHSHGPYPALPLAAAGTTGLATYLRDRPAFNAVRLRRLDVGTTLVVDRWAVDSTGDAWYHGAISTTAGTAGSPAGWVWGNAVTFARGPGMAAERLQPFRGIGMWATYRLLAVSSPAYIVRAAVKAGLSHLYVEVGRSPDGFYGAAGLAALLPVAHKAGLRVIAWVYPFLENLPADVGLTLAAARYRAPSGDTPDAVLADVEENVREADVRAYSQVVRAQLGEREPMGVATFPPQSVSGRTYPYRTVARSWDVLVPMDYWHRHARPYSAADSYAYVAQSLALIRTATGNPGQAIEALGQAFTFWEDGVDTPSAAEIDGALRAARDGGALGVSFFEWNHASPAEWLAIAAVNPGHGTSR